MTIKHIIIYIMDIKNITYCIWDDVTCFARKRRHRHRTKQAAESFLYRQAMPSEIPRQNWPGQRHDHLGERMICQAGKMCTACHCTSASRHIFSWHRSDQSSKNPEPAYHPTLKDSIIGGLSCAPKCTEEHRSAHEAPRHTGKMIKTY